MGARERYTILLLKVANCIFLKATYSEGPGLKYANRYSEFWGAALFIWSMVCNWHVRLIITRKTCTYSKSKYLTPFSSVSKADL